MQTINARPYLTSLYGVVWTNNPSETTLKYLISLLGAMFVSDPRMAAVVAILLIADLFTGIWAAKKRKEKISSLGFRQTIIKSIEYVVFLSCAVAISNTFEILSWIDQFSFMLVALTEFKSIGENLSQNSPHISGIFKLLNKKVKEVTSVDIEEDAVTNVTKTVETTITVQQDDATIPKESS